MPECITGASRQEADVRLVHALIAHLREMRGQLR